MQLFIYTITILVWFFGFYSDNGGYSESEKSNSDEELPDIEKDTVSNRKRKCEFSTLDETSSKKKDTSVLRWLPNGDKVNNFHSYLVNLSYFSIFLMYIYFL